jgi:hypothetical protein
MSYTIKKFVIKRGGLNDEYLKILTKFLRNRNF